MSGSAVAFPPLYGRIGDVSMKVEEVNKTKRSEMNDGEVQIPMVWQELGVGCKEAVKNVK